MLIILSTNDTGFGYENMHSLERIVRDARLGIELFLLGLFADLEHRLHLLAIGGRLQFGFQCAWIVERRLNFENSLAHNV